MAHFLMASGYWYGRYMRVQEAVRCIAEMLNMLPAGHVCASAWLRLAASLLGGRIEFGDGRSVAAQ